MFINLLLIAICVVIIIDISGIIDDIENRLSKWLKGKVKLGKPWVCSFCMYHHISLIYLICVGELTLKLYTLILIFAHLSGVLASLLICIRETLLWLIEKAYNALN
jgi:hypothetical protein